MKTTDESAYSEWLGGPELITRTWAYDQTKKQSHMAKPLKPHWHARGQLLCIETGLIQVKTDMGSWLLPPQRAGWIPPNATHSVYMSEGLKGASVLLTPDECAALPNTPCVIGVNDMLRALINRTALWSKTEALQKEQQHIVAVILDEIRNAPHEPLHLPMPKEPRLVQVAQAILANPTSRKNTAQWASLGAMSERTLRRQMRADTGMSFTEWRQQAQLNIALEMLVQGHSVASTADALGYATPSNFIAMFRRVFGDSPARYVLNKNLKL